MAPTSAATKGTTKRPRGRSPSKVAKAKRPRGRPPLNDVLRPVCPEGHVGWKVQLAGTYAKSWGPHSRFRYRCVPPGWDTERKRRRREVQAQLDDPDYAPEVLTEPVEVEPTDDPDWSLEDWLHESDDRGPRPHTFIGTALSARHPTADHPHGGEACEICEHEYRRNEGPNTGRDFLFSLREIAKALSNVAKGGSYRGSGRWIRSEAVRNKVDPDRPAGKEHRQRRKDAGLAVRTYRKRSYQRAVSGGDYSRESRLVAAYIDAFAPLLLAGHEPTTWPARIGLDSRPLKVPTRDPLSGKPKAAGADMGEILCAIDLTVYPTRIIKMAVAGGKDGESWLDFLQSIPTTAEPEVVVADRGTEIRWAVERAWPTTHLYACEGHLMKNAQDAATKDKAYKFVPNPAKPRLSSKGPALWVKDIPDLAQSSLWLAIERMQHSTERWDELKKVVEEVVPNDRDHQHLRSFITNTEQLVVDQIEYRALHPGTPRGAGAAESVFSDLDRWFSGRVFRNRRRLDLVLSLIRLENLGLAEERVFFQVLRRHFQSNDGRSKVVWTAH